MKGKSESSWNSSVNLSDFRFAKNCLWFWFRQSSS